MDRETECSLDGSHGGPRHVHLRNVLHRAVHLPVHPEHLPSIRCKYLLGQQSLKKSVRCRLDTILDANVQGDWHRWGC